MKLPTYLGAAICFFLAISDFFLQAELTRWSIVALAFGVALVALPQVERLKAGLAGVEYVTKAREYMHEARQGAMIARTYFSLLSVMAGRWGTHRGTLDHVGGLLASAARTREPLTPDHIRQAISAGDPAAYPNLGVATEGTREGPSGSEEILRQLAEMGLLEISGEGEDVSAQVVPKFRDAIIEAFAHED